MAAKSDIWEDIENWIECPLCLESFQDPVSLGNCSHTFCKNCVGSVPLVTYNGEQGIMCPQCRQFSKQGHFNMSFLMNSYVELYNLHSSKIARCVICKVKHVQWMCQECQFEICHDCRNNHSKDEGSKYHTFKIHGLVNNTTLNQALFCANHPDEKSQLYCMDCQVFLCRECSLSSHQGHTCDTIGEGNQRLLPVVEDLLDSLEKDLDYCKLQHDFFSNSLEEINKEYKELRAKYQAEMQRLTSLVLDAIETQGKKAMRAIAEQERVSLMQFQSVLDANKVEMQRKRGLVDLARTTLDAVKGRSLLKLLNGGLIDKLKQEERKSIFQTVPTPPKLTFTPNPDMTRDVVFVKSPGVIKEGVEQESDATKLRVWSTTVKDTLLNVGDKEAEVILWGDPVRLSYVEGNIWIPSRTRSGDYEIFDTLDKTIRQKFCADLFHVTSMWQTSRDEVLITSESGLYSFTPSGQVKYKVSSGKFTEACLSGQNLVAFETSRCEVQVYTLTNDRWSIVSNFTLRDTDGRLKHLHIHKHAIYISYHWKEKVCKYSMEGDFIEEYGGESQKGQFLGPQVIGSDCEDSLIVCNHSRNIQVRSCNGEWQEHPVYRLPGVSGLLDLLKVNDRLYVLWGMQEERKLSVFKLHPGVTPLY